MFGLCVITTVSLVGMIWFRSFEEDTFVLLNPGEEEQQRFYAERDSRTPTIYANITEALGTMRATIYEGLGFFKDYSSKKAIEIEEEYRGEVYKLPLSGDK
ncbi:MAG: hypothetical protein A3B10_00465 [Candidatus Doudnabacteria bacterium RIFCSPLOWO2_01_FULL_44_21]|uniref:Uncharacterized protein n=1 Tax=Candidatus Doudnabacteria bacterium RIFCSPLOWO2_01_FULL_44_21 TaxID=1817841 RepID=A0A1F5PXI0_9BACT|nr:MAG: hypothetical protein A3B10_00465 [Candidatus Doudnabacteria bacterium RIFCSPLOWO2_01_FULL_44_21]